MTADQRFYIGYAQSWLGKEREAATIAHIKSDPGRAHAQLLRRIFRSAGCQDVSAANRTRDALVAAIPSLSRFRIASRRGLFSQRRQ